MVKIAVLSDVHANLPALRAALAAIQRKGCDAIYHTGDAIAIGPHSAECLGLLLDTPNVHLIMGNHEAWFVHGLPQPRPAWLSDDELAHQRWLHAQLNPALRPVVARWPYVIHAEWEGVRVALMHYPPAGEPGAFAPFVQERTACAMDALFTDYRADVVFFGHDHTASDVGGRARYINPGSLGCYDSAVARFVTLTCESGRYTLHKHAVPYDDALLFADLEKRQVPARAFIRQAFFKRANQIEASR
jgi:putative phosphoesterase